jgi:hypothetical protein
MPNKPLQATSITAPGYFGLNTQDSGVDMSSSFALIARNAVIDRYGRIGARKGWSYTTTSGGTSSAPEMIVDFDNHDGTYTIISAGNNKLFTGETTMTEVFVRNSTNTGNQTYTITDNDWQFAPAQYSSGSNASAHAVMVQKGHPALMYHKMPTGGGGGGSHVHTGSFGFQRLGDVGNVPTGFTVTTFTPSCALGAFGRMWLANTGNNNKLTVYYSVLLDPSDFTGSGSGVINIEKVVPGDDRIVSLAAHNDFLIIFCERNIVIYNNAGNISNLALQDVIVGVGCIARDSVQNIGTDLMFLSATGVRSLARTIQEKSAPVRDISRNVRDTLLDYISGEDTDKIKSVYYAADAFYLLTLPSSGFTYYFDLRQFLQDGSARATVWDNISPKSLCATHDRRLLLGKTNGIAAYTGYLDDTLTYIFSYYTPYLDFGSPSVIKMLKKIGIVTVGASATTFDIKWAFDYATNYKAVQLTTPSAAVSEYGIAEYNIAEYSLSVVLENLKKQLSGNGNVVQIGVDAEVNGFPVSIQKLDIYAVTGRTI